MKIILRKRRSARQAGGRRAWPALAEASGCAGDVAEKRGGGNEEQAEAEEEEEDFGLSFSVDITIEWLVFRLTVCLLRWNE